MYMYNVNLVEENKIKNAFSDTKQKHVCCKICKVRKVFGCVAGTYYFQCQVS